MRDWKDDVSLVNHTLTPGCMGVMSDYASSGLPGQPWGAVPEKQYAFVNEMLLIGKFRS